VTLARPPLPRRALSLVRDRTGAASFP